MSGLPPGIRAEFLGGKVRPSKKSLQRHLNRCFKMHYSFSFFLEAGHPSGDPFWVPLMGVLLVHSEISKFWSKRAPNYVVSGVFETLFLKQKSFNFGAKELHFGVKKLQKRGQKRPKMTAMSTFQKRKKDLAVRLKWPAFVLFLITFWTKNATKIQFFGPKNGSFSTQKRV